jgi:hypothetical protein
VRAGKKQQRNAHKVLDEQAQRRAPLMRPRGRWAENVKICRKEGGRGKAVRLFLARDEVKWRAVVKKIIKYEI